MSTSNGEHSSLGRQTPQDAQPPAGSQSAITAYDRMLQEKERVIRENIASKYSKIHQVERQLESLRVALHVNVGPRRQALELLRSKIEAQNYKIDQHRTDYRKHKQLAEQALAAMEREEALKNQMAEELNTLVQQSAGAQLKKLEELSEELEHLTAGLPFGPAANGGGSSGAAGSAAAPAAAGSGGIGGDAGPAVSSAPPAAAAGQGQEEREKEVVPAAAQGAAAAAAPPQEQQAAAEEQGQQQEGAERRRQLEEQQRAAASARSRHVQLGARRPAPSLIPQAPSIDGGGSGGASAGSLPGPFRGFD